MKPIISIGLEPHIVEAIKAKVGHIVAHDTLPRGYTHNGQVFIESPVISRKYLAPRAVLYYCYFEDPQTIRRALALSNTPTFPDVRKTILHDDKALSLIQAVSADPGPKLPRGFIDDSETIHDVETTVAKWGEWHCGEGKKLCQEGELSVPEPSVLEPFVDGESIRVLRVGNIHVGSSYWQLHYESDDWRKNVNSKITVLPKVDQDIFERTEAITSKLGLNVTGVDFIRAKNGEAYLLEVNAYPGLEDAPGAEDKFVELAVDWIKRKV